MGKRLQLGAVAVPADPCESRIDHVADVRDRDAGLRDVCRQHHALAVARRKDALLFYARQARVQGQDVEAVREPLLQELRVLEDLALPGLEHQDVTRSGRQALADALQAIDQP